MSRRQVPNHGKSRKNTRKKYEDLQRELDSTSSQIVEILAETSQNKQNERTIVEECNFNLFPACFSRILMEAFAPVFGIDASYRIQLWNTRLENLTGWKAQEMIGKPLDKIIYSVSTEEQMQQVLESVLREDKTKKNVRLGILTNTNQLIHIATSLTPVVDPIKNKVAGLYGIGNDVTERQVQERQYAHVMMQAKAPIVELDKDANITAWNAKTASLTGYRATDVIGMSILPLVEDKSRQLVAQSIQQASVFGIAGVSSTLRLINATGGLVEIAVCFTPRFDRKGSVISVVAIGQDVTEKNAKEVEHEKLLHSANAPIIGVDTSGRIVIFNKKAEATTEYIPSEVMGQKLVETFIAKDDRNAVETVINKALQGIESANCEVSFVTKQGRKAEILLNATPTYDCTGKIAGVITIGQDITDRIIQEQEYSRLIDTANAPIFGVDRDYRIIIWNKKAATITQYTNEDTMGQNVLDFVSLDFREAVSEVLAKALNGLETAIFEIGLNTKSGRRLDILLNATPKYDHLGNISGVVGIGQDITDRRIQEQEYTRLIDTANAPIFGVDKDCRVNIWNRKAAQITEYSVLDVLGASLVDEFIPDEYKEDVGGVLLRALQGTETANFEFPLITRAGRRLEILLNATPRYDEKGVIIGVVGIGQDITIRIAQEQEYSRLIDTANAPIFGVDENGLVDIWNKKAAEITQYTQSDVMGENLVEKFITNDYKQAVGFVLQKALNGTETANFEFPLITKDGRRVEILLNATPRFNEHGKVMGMVGIGQDITDRIAQEQEYSRLIDTANAPIFGVDMEGLVNIWNKKAAEITQYSPDDVMGKDLVQQFISEEYRSAVGLVMTQARQGVQRANFNFPLITKAGRRVEILLNATPRYNQLGHIVGVVGIGQDITDRIAQEQEYARLIDTANAPIFGVDKHGLVNIWNKKAAEITQYTQSDVMGENLVEEFITNDYKEAVGYVLQKALNGTETANFEFPLITKAGHRVEILLNATPRFNEHGQVMGMVGIGQDITDRIAQEQEYSRLIDTANAPIFGVDMQGLVNIWNKKAAEITQYSTKAVMGKDLVQQFISEEYRSAVGLVLTQARQGVQTANFNFPLITRSGRRVEILLNATPRYNELGQIVGVVGIGQDITDQIAQEQEYARLIDTANAPIFGVDKKGLVNIWNKKAAEITQYTQSDVMGENLVEKFITNDYKQAVGFVLQKALNGTETANFEFPLITKDGRRVEILLNATPRFNEHGKVMGMVGIGQDITDRIAQEQEYSRLIDTANAPIFGVDMEGLVNIWNKKAAEITQYSPDDVMGKDLVQQFISEEYRSAVGLVMTQARQGVQRANFNFPLITKAGRRVEILLNATPRYNQLGHIVGVVGIGQDITDRIAQEQEYARLIDTANAPIFGVDKHGLVNIWNKKAAEITQYTQSDVMGENLVEEFITNDYKEAVGYVLQKALNGTETANFEFPLITKTGRRVEILLNATPRFNEHGQVMGMVGIGQDITDRIAQEQEYSRLIDKASAPIFGVDVNGCVNIWNRKAVEITQYSTEEVLGEKLVDTFIPDDYRAAVAEVFSDALKGDEGANFEVPLITKTGRHVNILLNATARFDQHGGIVGVVGIGQDITERIAQEQEYTRLIDTANAPIFGVDNNGCVNIWNKKAAEITQYTPSDVMGENLVEKFITDDYKDAVRSVLAKALDGIETANFEFPLITKMGRRVEILLNATSRFNEHGKVMGMVGIGQDITDRIAQEQEYSRLIDTANAPIFGVDANMCVNIWNKKAAQITSYSIAEVMGENLVETFISPEYRPIVADVLSKALKGIQTANFEFPLITRPGTRIEILLNATPRMDSNGTIVGVVGIGQDITDRIAQEHEYFRLIDTANAPIFGVDTIGNINEWNQKIEEITGYSKATVLGLSLVNTFIIPESRQQVRQLLNQALIGVDVGEMELPMTTKQGLFLLLLVNASSKKDMHGNIRGAIGVGQDYTARKQMEAAKVNFLASFSHELRTPLNSVLGMLELLKEKKNLDKNSERHVHMAYVSGSLLLNLINDILDLSKIEAGHMEITAAPFHMHDLLDYSIEIFKFKARERNIILEQKCGKDVPKMVIGDVVRLRQILLNLLSNAIKFTSEGSITVTCNVVLEPSLPPQFKKLLFQVIDTGVGMDAEERSRLFSLFTKLERTRQNNPTGSGLGLAICKQLVQLMDGEIDVDSELNQGSNFYFTVVVRLLDEEQIMLHQNDDALYASDDVVVTDTFAAPLETKTTYTDAMTDKNSVINSNGPGPLSFTVIPSQARILVVEDNEFNWEVVKCYLQEDDHMLQWEVNGRRAVDAYVGHHEEFDMVFMDCEMPVMDGYTATRTIRQFEAQHNLSHMPILGLTAYAMSGDRQKCLDAGMDEFIVKPISKVTLRKAIRQWMRVKYLGIKGPTNSSGLNSNPGSGPTTLTMTTTTTTTTKLSSKPTSDPLKVTTTTTTLYPATSPRLMERIVSPTREPSRSSARMTHQQESEKSSYMRTDASPSCFAPRLMPASRHMQQLDLANAISNLELDNPMAANRYHQAAYSFRPGAPVNSIFSAGSSAHQSSSLRSSLGNTSLQLTWKQSRASIISATLPASFHDGFEEEDSDEEVKDDDREASICSLLTRSSERSDFTGRERISGVRSLERSGTFDRGCGKSRRRRRQIHSGTYPKGNPTLWSHPPFPGKKGTRSRGRRSKVCGMGSGTDFGSQSQGQSQRSDERRLAVDARDKTIPKLSLPERAHDLADTILAVKNRIPQPIVSIVQPTPPVESPPSIMGINPMDIAIPEGDPINFGLGVDQCGGHEELFVSLLKKFAVSCDQIVSRIDTCFQSRDITTMRREAHSLKGSSAYVAALRVSKVAFRLQVGCERVMNAQELAASDDSMTVQRELEVVQSTYDLLKKEHRLLQGYLKRNFAFAGSFTEPSQSADKAAYGEDDEDNANVCALM